MDGGAWKAAVHGIAEGQSGEQISSELKAVATKNLLKCYRV